MTFFGGMAVNTQVAPQLQVADFDVFYAIKEHKTVQEYCLGSQFVTETG
jgi:hypothetical protein